MKWPVLIVMVYFLGVLLAGCGAAASSALPSPSAQSTPIGSKPIPTVSPRATSRPGVLPRQGGVELQPHSTPVVAGRTYPFRLYTHCGVDFAVDFDGSFWDLDDPAWATVNGNPPPRIGNPFQDGTMTLTDADHARFDFQGGQIHYRRHHGAKVVPGLCS